MAIRTVGLEPYNSHFSTWQLLGLADFDVEAGVLKYRGRHCYLRSATSLGTILHAVTQTASSEGSIITPGIITRNILITAKLIGRRPQTPPSHQGCIAWPYSCREARAGWARD